MRMACLALLAPNEQTPSKTGDVGTLFGELFFDLTETRLLNNVQK